MEAKKWWCRDTVAVVTGANKGIGLQIARELAQNGITTVLTARNEIRGLEAVRQLQKEGLETVTFHRLDLVDPESAVELAEWLKKEYGGIDILVNNAAVGMFEDLERMSAAKAVLGTNYYGTKRVTETLLPLMRDLGRIVFVSSQTGDLDVLHNPKWKPQMMDASSLTKDTIDAFVQDYLRDVSNGCGLDKGWPREADDEVVPGVRLGDLVDYRVSKIALNAYVRVLSKELASEPSRRSVYANCMCPGLTNTDMSKHVGHSVEIAADTAVWLALLPRSRDLPSGKFFSTRKDVGFSGIPVNCNGKLMHAKEFLELQRRIQSIKS